MPDWVVAVILGVIEGITEFLPISSTGHLLLAQHWLPRQTDLFNAVIQCGAVLAVIVIFTERIKQLIFEWRDPAVMDYLFKLTLAFVITGVGGLVLHRYDFQLPETARPVASALLMGGVLFLVVEQWLRQRPLSEQITWRIAIAVGLAQLLAAVFPGTSRSGATILAALVLGLSRPAATEFSFLLGIPTLLSAGGLKLVSELREPSPEPVQWEMLLIGSVVAAVTAFAAVKWLLHFVRSHTFIGFAWYRILFGIVMLILIGREIPVEELPGLEEGPRVPGLVPELVPGREP
jgi:undecaprenyl-diphosphatase